MAWSTTPAAKAWSGAVATNKTEIRVQNTGAHAMLVYLVVTGGGAPSGTSDDGFVLNPGDALAITGLAGHDAHVRSAGNNVTTYEILTD